jgi:RHS repeat-associated protein
MAFRRVSKALPVSYLTTDHLGSPRILTDQLGQVTSRRDFHPYGEETFTAERTAALGYEPDALRQKFTSYERDSETDLDYAKARMFSYSHGRFTSPDDFRNDSKTTNPESWNLYVYVGNNPLTYADPTGKEKLYKADGTFLGKVGSNDTIRIVKKLKFLK